MCLRMDTTLIEHALYVPHRERDLFRIRDNTKRVANDRKKSSKRSINTLRGVSSGTNNIATNDSGKRNQEKKKR